MGNPVQAGASSDPLSSSAQAKLLQDGNYCYHQQPELYIHVTEVKSSSPHSQYPGAANFPTIKKSYSLKCPGAMLLTEPACLEQGVGNYFSWSST